MMAYFAVRIRQRCSLDNRNVTKLTTALMCLVATTVYAQNSRPDRFYAGGLVLASIQPEGSVDDHYLSGPLGGTVASVSGFAGVRVGQWVSVEGEVSAGGALSGPQSRPYAFPDLGVTFTTSHRDLITTGQVRIHPARLHEHVSVEPLVGFGIAHGETHHTNTILLSGFSGPHPEPDSTLSQSNWSAFVLGLDVQLPISRHVVIVPAARAYFLIGRETDPPSLGMGSAIYRIGAGVQLMF
jgi:hypothetical protein